MSCLHSVFRDFLFEVSLFPFRWKQRCNHSTVRQLCLNISLELNSESDEATRETYLTEVFQEGERTGQKADPANISKAIWRAEHSDGSSIFEKDWRLPHTSANSRIFSRLTGKKRTALAVKTLRDMRQTKRRTSKSWLKKWNQQLRQSNFGGEVGGFTFQAQLFNKIHLPLILLAAFNPTFS